MSERKKKQAVIRGADVEIHVLQWTQDHATGVDGVDEEPTGLLYGPLKLDGKWVDYANAVRVETSNDFAEVWVQIIPRSIKYVAHTDADWPVNRDDDG